MKISRVDKFYRGLGKSGQYVESFEILVSCCSRFEKEYNKEHLIFLSGKYTSDDKDAGIIMFGAPHEYILDDVKFCPFCGEKIVFDDGIGNV